MKNNSFKSTLAFFTLVFALFCFACGGNQTNDSANKAEVPAAGHDHAGHDHGQDHAGHDHGDEVVKEVTKAHGSTTAHTSAYICPMHCPDSGSDKAGVCPACGMDYEPLAEHSKNGHTH